MAGVASYMLELFVAVQGLDSVYVPIGLGSGICGAIATRDAFGLGTEIIGVVSAAAPATPSPSRPDAPYRPKSRQASPTASPAASQTRLPWSSSAKVPSDW